MKCDSEEFIELFPPQRLPQLIPSYSAWTSGFVYWWHADTSPQLLEPSLMKACTYCLELPNVFVRYLPNIWLRHDRNYMWTVESIWWCKTYECTYRNTVEERAMTLLQPVIERQYLLHTAAQHVSLLDDTFFEYFSPLLTVWELERVVIHDSTRKRRDAVPVFFSVPCVSSRLQLHSLSEPTDYRTPFCGGQLRFFVSSSCSWVTAKPVASVRVCVTVCVRM